MNIIHSLMKKWKIFSYAEFVIICLVFSLAGMVILYERRPIFHALGITHQTPFLIKFISWLMVVFPCYQLNLLVFGALLGKFNFFWEKEKRLGRFLWKAITRRQNT